jgi:UPF0716 protein FxsA
LLLKLLVLFVCVPLVELWLLLLLAEHTSVGVALAVVIVTGVTGTLLARAQGWHTLRAIRAEVARGRFPGTSLIDAAMILCAGALLLTPGLLTDALGLSMLIPGCRRLYRRMAQQWIRSHFQLQTWTVAEPDGRRGTATAEKKMTNDGRREAGGRRTEDGGQQSTEG